MKFMLLGAAVILFSISVNASESTIEMSRKDDSSRKNESLLKYESNYSVQETADRFESIAKSKGLNIFARIDHQKNAENVGLTLRPTQVIIFGNPKVGTPLMTCAQDMAIDLPQKMLVSEDANHKVWLSFNNPQYLKKRHNMKGCDDVIEKVSNILKALSLATASK